MSGLKSFILPLAAGAAALAAAASVQAQAAQQELSEQAVKDFLDSAEQEMTQAIKAGEYQRVVDWTRQHVADDATFFVSGEIYVGDQRKGFAVLSLNKKDMLQASQVALGMLSGASGESVQDYFLDIEVVGFHALGAEAATVDTRITEKATLAPPGGGEGEPVQVTATADCSHVVQAGSAPDDLKLAMSACQARTQF